MSIKGYLLFTKSAFPVLVSAGRNIPVCYGTGAFLPGGEMFVEVPAHQPRHLVKGLLPVPGPGARDPCKSPVVLEIHNLRIFDQHCLYPGTEVLPVIPGSCTARTGLWSAEIFYQTGKHSCMFLPVMLP